MQMQLQAAPAKFQPAIFGGLFIGVLSALPLIGAGNCLCCMWAVAGGVLASFLLQQNHPFAIESADGALVGLLAGFLGGVVCLIVEIPIALAVGPLQQKFLEHVIASNPDFPPEFRSAIENAARHGGFGLLTLIFGFVRMIAFGVFSMLGGLLGVALFEKKDIPPGTTEVLPPP